MTAEKKTPQDWAASLGYQILDPDGWRCEGSPSFDEPLTLEEFWLRFLISTVRSLP